MQKNQIIFGIASLFLMISVHGADDVIRNGARIAFMGDSITDMGFWESGYCSLVISGLKTNGINAVGIPAGISNQSSKHMIARLNTSVLDKNVSVMTLSSGVNDVGQNIPLEQYKENMGEMVRRAKGKGLTVYILTASMITEDPVNQRNIRLKPYNDFLRELAKQEKCKLADVNEAMWKEYYRLKEAFPKMKGNMLTCDGLHMNTRGDIIIAKCVLKAFGLTEAQIAKAEKAWEERRTTVPVTLSLSDYGVLSESARSEGVTLEEYIAEKTIKNLKNAEPEK